MEATLKKFEIATLLIKRASVKFLQCSNFFTNQSYVMLFVALFTCDHLD